MQLAFRAMRVAFAATVASYAHAVTLPPDAQQRVGTATFEVVMEKPQQDTLSYERPLQLDLLPFSQRTEPYQSIGTAFAIGEHRYVSAAHVMNAGFQSQFGEPALRDANGQVFKLDKVLAYSSSEDFVVFTLKDDPATGAWPVNRKPTLNEPIFAVGNALGEGIVVRDGLFTSQTPEQLDGKWKWIRFSAAASPGNSGGPLLDQEGRVIGVVLRKSPNENLNYAAPISLVLDAPHDHAHIEGLVTYWLPNFDRKETQRISFDIPMPETYAELAATVTKNMHARYDEMQHDLLTKNAADIFPNGDGSQQLLHTVYTTSLPYLISRNADGTWDAISSGQTADATLANNGSVAISVLGGAMLGHVRLPDDVTHAALDNDSHTLMDYLLKAVPLKRPVGADQVRITSLGDAQSQTSYTDSYGRVWQLRVWNIGFQDAVVVGLSMPVPDGYIVLIRGATTASTHDTVLDLRALTDFVYVSLTGNLAQWAEYMSNKDRLPPQLANLQIDYKNGKAFTYRSKRLDATVAQPIVKNDKDTILTLEMAYFADAGKVVWDVAGLSIAEKNPSGAGFNISRHTRPAGTLPDSYRTTWAKMIGRDYPFDASMVDSNGTASVAAIYPYPKPTDAPDDASADLLYEVSYWTGGKHTQQDMDAALVRVLQGVKVIDDRRGSN